jgi:hypothetical protein
MFDQVKAHRQKSGWSLIKVAPEGFRPFDFYAQLNKSTPQRIFLSDIPITLNALNQAIGAYIGKSYIGVSEAEALLECRELRAFRKVLEELITSNPITKGRVVVEIVKI